MPTRTHLRSAVHWLVIWLFGLAAARLVSGGLAATPVMIAAGIAGTIVGFLIVVRVEAALGTRRRPVHASRGRDRDA